MKQLLILFCFLFFQAISHAQYYNTGQDPGSLKWMQIKTNRFTVIYPRSYGSAGTDLARSLDEAYSRLAYLYPQLKFRIPVIIHNYATSSNGYVAWAPSRMELYPTPEMNAIPLNPNRQLAIHELTHVLQMESLDKGFTKVMSILAGQQFTGIVSSLLPLWFLEGDAVFSESVLTPSGRGRNASFQKQLKAVLIEKGNMYKYDKIVNGSFRDFVPDHYHTGFEMMAWSYAKYDSSLWKKALNLTANEPFTINPVNLSLRRTASLTKKRLFKETFDSLKTLWTLDDAGSKNESFETLNPPKREEYINYYSPILAGSDSLIAVKTSLSELPAFVLINPSQKTEKKIHIPGYSYPWFLSYAKGKLVWVETHSDPRWENRTWSVIKLRDLKQKVTRQLSSRTRYLSASISTDGKYIAATENTVGNQNNLVLIDALTGAVLESIPAPGNAFLQRPQWAASAGEITVISLTELGEGIISYNTTAKVWKTMIDASNNDLQSTYMRNDSLFFISSVSGTDNVYLLKPDKTVISLTRSRFGASDLSVHGQTLLFSDYSYSGNNICYTSLTAGSKLTTNSYNSSVSYLINRFRPYPELSVASADNVYAPVPYRKWQHLFRFHSWMPFYADIEAIKSDPTSVRPGLTLMTQNNLSTLISSFGYEYSDNMHKFHSSIRWLGWYLVFETRMDYGNTPHIEKFKETVADPANIFRGYELTNTLSLPLTFQGSRFTQNFYLSASSTLRNDYIYLKENGSYDAGQNELTGRFYLSNYQRSAVRDISPRWAQIIDLSYSYYPFDKAIYGDIFTAKTAFYFPGILKNNGFRVRFEAENQNPKKFILGNRASFSRSYDNIVSRKHEFYSADYFLPLAYPDFNISSFLYLTRIRTDLFYDLTRGTGNYIFTSGPLGSTTEIHDYRETFRSFGVQLMTDFYVFRIPFMVSAGMEASWRKLGEAPFLRMLFNIDLFGMSIGKRGMEHQR
jgi:hypothetical protein